jgi:hypothetical protein
MIETVKSIISSIITFFGVGIGCILYVAALIAFIATCFYTYNANYAMAIRSFFYAVISLLPIYLGAAGEKYIERRKKEKEDRAAAEDQADALSLMQKTGCNAEKIFVANNFSIGIDYQNKVICITHVNPKTKENFNPKLFKFIDVLKTEFMHTSVITTEVKVIVKDFERPTYSVEFHSQRDADYWYGIFTAIVNGN